MGYIKHCIGSEMLCQEEIGVAAHGRGRLAKARAGKVVGGGKPPYGYRYEDGQFHIVEHEAAIVRMIYKWYVNGKDGGPPMIDLAIARELSTMGLQTPGERNGSTLRKRAPGMWSDNAVHRILTSETYAGVWRFGKRPRKHGKRGKRQRKDQIPNTITAVDTGGTTMPDWSKHDATG
jgi:hypothetical protein